MSIRILATTAVVVLSTGTANAWEVKSTSAGDPIRWSDGKVVVDVSMGAAASISAEKSESAAILALQHWSAEVSDTLVLTIVDGESDDEVDDDEIAQDGESVIRWGVEAGPFVDPEALATTYLTYRTTTGQIMEADIVVNAVDYKWTVVGSRHCENRYDLQNILTHEAGHFFGLSHTQDRVDSTMFPSASSCETSKRDLADDDKAGIVFLYEDALEPESPVNLAQLANCSTGGTSGLVVAAMVLLVLVGLRRRPPRRKEREISGLTQRRAMAVLHRERKIGEVRAWMTLSCFVLLGLALGASTAAASTLQFLSPQELSTRADLVVDGEVIAQRTELEAGWPVTISTLKVRACQADVCPKTVVVRQMGGEVGEIGLVVSGVDALAPGSSVVLFLRKRGVRYQTIGMSQGVFYSKTVAGKRILIRDVHSLSLVGQKTHKALDRLPFTDFKSVFGVSLKSSLAH